MKVDEVQRETFEPLVEETFKVAAGDTGFEARLIEVAAMGETVGPGGRSAFSIVLRGPKDDWVEQQTCRIEHEELGALEIFLVPIGPDDDGMKYEAVFT